jgi:DNA-binding CsgD family transcriptional regulator
MSDQNPTTETDEFTVFAGFVGFSSALLTLFLVFFRSVYASGSIASIPIPIILVACIALFLKIASLANDVLISKVKTLLLVALVSGLLGIGSSLFSSLVGLSLALSAIGFATVILFWGSYLSTLSHKSMSSLSALSIAWTGILGILSARLPEELMAVVIALLFLMAWICAWLIRGELGKRIPPINKQLSFQRSAPGKGNRYTLVTVGFILGVSGALVFHLDFSVLLNEAVLSIALACAGFLALLLRNRLQSAFEDLSKRSLAAVITLSLLPLAFLPVRLQVVFIGLLLLVTAVNFMLTIDAIAETARFNLISPVWLIGREGALFLIGVVVGSLLFVGGFLFDPLGRGLLISCALSVVACNILQVFIDNQVYPTLPEGGEPLEEEYDEQQSESLLSARGGAIWRAKLKVIEDKYSLSPRQKEIMELLVKGRDSRYIMTQFVISRSTAKTHIYNLYKKVEVHSRQELLDLVERTEVDGLLVQNRGELRDDREVGQHG